MRTNGVIFTICRELTECDKGRPYGGLGFICQKRKDVTYHILNSESDRVCVLQVIQNGAIIISVIGVYLPHYNGSSYNLEVYLDTLSKIQSYIEICGETDPVIIVGDFNASLPQSAVLTNMWYRCRPFNKNSALLYNFIESNDSLWLILFMIKKLILPFQMLTLGPTLIIF